MTCNDCIHAKVCDNLITQGLPWEDGKYPAEKWCDLFKNTADVVEVVRCKDCTHAQELDLHCEINRGAYRHCALYRGNTEPYVWHKYKKYYKEYSIVPIDGFCDEGERREDNEG